MKDYIEEVRHMSTYDLEGPIPQVIEVLKTKSEGLKEPQLVFDFWYEDCTVFIKGWRPMTDAEKAKAEKKRAQAKAANEAKKAKLREEELELLQRLADKYEIPLG